MFHSHEAAHFIARFQSKFEVDQPRGARFHDYDGMLNKGYAQQIPGAKLSSHLTGSDADRPMRQGYASRYIIYSLRGGTSAQQVLINYQASRAKTTHDIYLSSTELHFLPEVKAEIKKRGLAVMHDDFRVWLPKSRLERWREYVTVNGKGMRNIYLTQPKKDTPPHHKIRDLEDDLKSATNSDEHSNDDEISSEHS